MHCNLTVEESARVVPDLLARLAEFEAAVGFPRVGVLALVSGRYDVAADIFHAAAGEALRELARDPAGERRYLVYLAAANGARLLALGAGAEVRT